VSDVRAVVERLMDLRRETTETVRDAFDGNPVFAKAVGHVCPPLGASRCATSSPACCSRRLI